MVCVDFIDQKVYSEAEGLFVSDLDLGIKGLIRARYPFALDSDFFSYVNLSHYCMNYLDEIVQRANQKNEKIKYNVTTLMKEEEKPFNVEERLNKQATIGQRIADDVARFGGSWTFIIVFVSIMAIWMLVNIMKPFGIQFDPYPFILLNLALSTIAAIQAPLIMMSQNRAADYDRLQARNDFNVNKTSELEIRLLHEKIDHMVQQDQFELLEIQKLQTEMLVSLGNQLAQLKQLQK
ncbi:DUF1003 domain-containing protein [Streptococcus agalactiae]|nr:DUF1003 domain-containing protein [Streptococcus agalactiae]